MWKVSKSTWTSSTNISITVSTNKERTIPQLTPAPTYTNTHYPQIPRFSMTFLCCNFTFFLLTRKKLSGIRNIRCDQIESKLLLNKSLEYKFNRKRQIYCLYLCIDLSNVRPRFVWSIRCVVVAAACHFFRRKSYAQNGLNSHYALNLFCLSNHNNSNMWRAMLQSIKKQISAHKHSPVNLLYIGVVEISNEITVGKKNRSQQTIRTFFPYTMLRVCVGNTKKTFPNLYVNGWMAHLKIANIFR